MNPKPLWPPFEYLFFDCDSTLSAVEGIDELARAKGLFEAVRRLTDAAMEGEVHLESVYDRRLQLLRPSRGEIRRLERLYRETVVPDARPVIAALRRLGKHVFIVSGGLYPAVRPFGEWLGVPAENIRAVEVAFDALSGEWWDYRRDRWGERPDVRYLRHEAGPLAQSHGKADVVRRLKGNRPGRSMLIGDGVSDLAARPAVERVVGFGGVVARPAVVARADVFIAANSLAPVLALATARPERQRLAGTPYEETLRKGLHLIADPDAVTFQKEAWRQAILRGF
ncbi:MAG: haloacid dehalogenase [Caldilineae bacterium]|nr:MAG: haloacid dehalogenase [Caldilineae bacterium]